MFISVAKHLQPFLTKFQTDSPVVPFLGPELKELMAGLMSCFVRKEHLEKPDTYQKLAGLDPQDKENQVLPKRVDVGFATRQSLKVASHKKAVRGFQIPAFKNECMTLLAALTANYLREVH